MWPLELDLRVSLERAIEAYRVAQHDWCESFLRYRMADKNRTDTQARAMADLEVDLVGARIGYEYAKLRYMEEINADRPLSASDAD